MTEWISVKDKSPKDQQKIIVYDESGFFFGCHYDEISLKELKINMTRWMPLPEPPQDE